eukprot:2310210-Pyramimonas_sp.AAC.1
MDNDARFDAAEILDVDVDAESNIIYKQFYKRLSEDERRLVRIYRAGAVSSETRRCSGKDCKLCGSMSPSFRHYWEECPKYHYSRT